MKMLKNRHANWFYRCHNFQSSFTYTLPFYHHTLFPIIFFTYHHLFMLCSSNSYIYTSKSNFNFDLFFSQIHWLAWMVSLNLLLCRSMIGTWAKNQLCEVETGQTNIILDIEESRGDRKCIKTTFFLDKCPIFSLHICERMPLPIIISVIIGVYSFPLRLMRVYSFARKRFSLSNVIRFLFAHKFHWWHTERERDGKQERLTICIDTGRIINSFFFSFHFWFRISLHLELVSLMNNKFQTVMRY